MLNLNKIIFILMVLGCSMMSYGDNKIEFYTYYTPSLYGSPLVQKIGVNKSVKYYLKNNYTDIGDSKNINGVGLVEGKANDENWSEFKVKYKVLLDLSKRTNQFIARADRIVGQYIENGHDHIISVPVASAAYSDENAKNFQIWFKEKIKNYDNLNEFKLSKGFFVEDRIIKKNSHYFLVVKFINPTSSKVGITGIKDWGKLNNTNENILNVHLSIYNGFDIFHTDLLVSNLINESDHQNIFSLEPHQSKELTFKIDEKEIEKIENFLKENHGVKLKFYTKFNLDFIYPSDISGRFNYVTKDKDFVY